MTADAKPLSDLIPTNWLDPMLTGPDSVLPGPGPYMENEIEALLRAIKQRVREEESRRYVSQQGWISVKDRLPTTTATVLGAYLPAFHKSTEGPRKRSWLITPVKFSGGQWRFIVASHKTRRSDRVKFWQPLPDVPSP